MRGLVRSWLINDPALAAIIGTRVYPVNMRDTRPDTVPYVVLRFGVQTPRIASAEIETLQLWAHDIRGDYGQIDTILKRAKEILTEIESLEPIITIEWLDTSEDQFDEGSTTLTKWSRYQIVTA